MEMSHFSRCSLALICFLFASQTHSPVGQLVRRQANGRTGPAKTGRRPSWRRIHTHTHGRAPAASGSSARWQLSQLATLATWITEARPDRKNKMPQVRLLFGPGHLARLLRINKFRRPAARAAVTQAPRAGQFDGTPQVPGRQRHLFAQAQPCAPTEAPGPALGELHFHRYTWTHAREACRPSLPTKLAGPFRPLLAARGRLGSRARRTDDRQRDSESPAQVALFQLAPLLELGGC